MIFFICYYIGITNSSAIQRYRGLHESPKMDLNDTSISRTTINMQKEISNETVTSITEKPQQINANYLSSFHVGITDSSAIQRYRNLHEFRKTNRNDNITRIVNIHRNTVDGTDDVTSEERSNILANNVEKTITQNKTMASSSSFWNFIRFVGATYFTEIRFCIFKIL